ncbi:DUF2637 domain-containing protein [Streptomyces sp. TLI_171]|uniref:DUF2637 domain-containing protein n=1 Tax=Streptomyces sp. TLI_171 TaxID=1938859 RepID=UPI000C1948DD|nr:DUF2637 domain-containing protein [Streptomyces sp. TLI_171]RKE21973.1 uncharacterized protein DUF2637 [Streptomyces sp. TLI_171]
MSTTPTTTATVHVTGWDRTAVIALGATGFALSYDSLQQMAEAVHVRGLLTYLFPFIVDGFIAYSIRALLVMRDAPLRARAYVWLLFGAATGTSLWANALHAVRMNEQSAAAGLRLTDTVVAVLSTIAPLASAGAVHLYILLARGPANPVDRDGQSGRSDQLTGPAEDPGTTGDLESGQQSALLVTDRPAEFARVTASPVSPVTALPVAVTEAADLGGQPVTDRPAEFARVTASPVSPVTALPVAVTEAADLGGQPVSGQPVTDRPADVAPVTASPVSPVTSRPVTDRAADRDTEELLEIAKQAVAEADNKLTRAVVATAIRGQQIPLSSDTLTQLMAQLREQQRKNQLADADRS